MTGNVELYQLEWYQPSEQPQSVLHQHGVDERFLPLDRRGIIKRTTQRRLWVVYRATMSYDLHSLPSWSPHLRLRIARDNVSGIRYLHVSPMRNSTLGAAPPKCGTCNPMPW